MPRPSASSPSGDEPSLSKSGASGNDVQLGGQSGLLHLLEMLALPDSLQRRRAVFLLAEQGHPSVFDALERMIRRGRHGIQARALRAMGQVDDPRAMELLLKHVKTWPATWEEGVIYKEAVLALADRGDKAAIPVLRGMLDNRRYHDTKGLVYDGHYFYLPIGAIVAALNKLGDETLFDDLLERAKARDIRAVSLLGFLQDRRAAPFLISALTEFNTSNFRGTYTGDESEWKYMMATIEALGEIGDPSAVPAILHYLYLPQVYMRNAAEALGKIGDPSAYDGLLHVLAWAKDHLPTTIWAILRALGKIGDPRAYEVLEGIINKNKVHVPDDPDHRAVAAEALGDLGGQRAVKPLLKALKDQNKDVRRSAVTALGKVYLLDVQVAPAVIGALGDRHKHVREAAAIVVGEQREAGAVEALIPLLSSRSYPERHAAQDALDRIATPEALAALEAAGR